MPIRYEDLSPKAQQQVWQEVSDYLERVGLLKEQRPDEDLYDFVRRLIDTVDDFIADRNHYVTFDVCQTTN